MAVSAGAPFGPQLVIRLLVDRIGQLILFVPRTAMAPVVMGVALAVLVLLGPTIFLPQRYAFDRLMEFLELILGRPTPDAAGRTRTGRPRGVRDRPGRG